MSTQKAILWDLDGTILDSISVMAEILEEIFPPLSIPLLSREELRSEFHGSLESSLARMSDNYHDQELLVRQFLSIQPRHYKHPISHPGMIDLIKSISAFDIKQAVVTSRGSSGRGSGGAHAIINTLGLESIVSVVISADECKAHKPDPDPLLIAIEKLVTQPEDTIMIGDQPVDAFAAQAAGTHCIIIDHEGTIESKNSLRSANPDALVHNALELRASLSQHMGVQL